MTFIHDNFLLTTESSKRLYHEFAADQPIIDYHNHLSPQEIAENRQFDNLFEMWIDKDHYKWRAMRANGINEEFCTGNASPQDKFMAFAKTVPYTLRNPLFHWTQLELKRFFDIDELLNEKSAVSIWEECNRQISQRDELRTHGILSKFGVTALCTTDDPADDLKFHRKIAEDNTCPAAVYPAFRPDWALFVHRPEQWNGWLEKLASVSDVSIDTLGDLLTALRQRHDEFHEVGARLSDHGCEYVPANFCDDATAGRIFDAARSGQAASPTEHEQFSSYLLLFLARLDAEKDWTNQLHIGVWRNNNSRLFQQAGRDIGCDSIGDTSQGRSLGQFLDRLDRENALPKTIVYNLNPSDNYLIATMLGNFQDGKTPGKMQLGSGWWFLDQKEGMQLQLNTLSNTGLLSRFVGMLTDSRSFMSFTRHEYFRRILCDLFGRDMENGEIPDDDRMAGEIISGICYQNARDFLGLKVS